MNSTYIKKLFSAYSTIKNKEFIINEEGSNRVVIENIIINDFQDFYEKYKGITCFISFKNCFFESFSLFPQAYEYNFKNKIDFISCTFKKFNINNIKKENKFKFSDLFSGNEDLKNNIKKLIITESEIEEKIILNNTYFNFSIEIASLEISNSYISYISLNNQKKIESYEIKESTIENFYIQNIKNFKKLDFINVIFKNNTEIIHVCLTESFLLNDVSFNNVIFDNFNLNNCTKQEIKRLILKKDLTIFNETDWSNIEASQDLYRQLKLFFDSQANYIMGDKFYKKEMNIYLKSCIPFSEFILLIIGKLISNFGQSWGLPLIWILSSTLFFMYSLDMSITLNEFAKFINPFSKAPDIKFSNHYFSWLIHKLLLSIFIYHFIIAVKRRTRRE